MDLKGREILDLEILFDIRLPQRMHTRFSEMEIKEIVDMEDKEHIIILGTAHDGNQIEMEFDSETGLLIRFGDITFSDYKKNNGVVRPHKIVIGDGSSEDELKLVMEVHKITFNEPIDEKTYSRPCCPLKPVRAPLFSRRKQIIVTNEVLDALVGHYRQVDKPDHLFIIKRQGNHLMMKTPRSPYFLEIKPETELDYFIRFLNVEVHFIKNDQELIDRLEIGREKRLVAKKATQNRREIP